MSPGVSFSCRPALGHKPLRVGGFRSCGRPLIMMPARDLRGLNCRSLPERKLTGVESCDLLSAAAKIRKPQMRVGRGDRV